MISVCIAYFYAIYVRYEHRSSSGQSKKECSYPVPSIFDIIICGSSPHQQSGCLLVRVCPWRPRRARSGREAVGQYRHGVRICGSCRSGCICYSGCGGANERASSASPPLFALSPTAEIDSIASLPTGASADGPPSPASIAGSLTGSLVPLVYVEDFYRKHNRSVRALVIMCHGLTHDDGTPAINVSAARWSTMKKSVVRVSSKEYQSEITCRWDFMCAYDPDLKANSRDIPRPSQWKLAKLQIWLDNNPVTDDGERAFLLDAVDERIGASARAEAEKAVVLALFNKRWVGKEPILWLIHALVDNNEISHAYLERFDVPSDHMVIENQNTPETRAACCWAMMAAKWNDPLFFPRRF
jgi:hypothetical protein